MKMEAEPVKQEQRTFLRERFLRMLGSLQGKRAEITLVERTRVSATLGPADIEFENIQVTDLNTPMGTIPEAVVRTSDIVSIKVDSAPFS